MIERYSLPKMKKIWTDEKRFENYLKVEIAATYAFMKARIIPFCDFEVIKNNATFNLNDIYEIEKETKHDVIAFTRAVSKSLGDEKKWIHYGLTSTDVVDTANALSIREANEILETDLNGLLSVLKKNALKYQNTPCIGRTHGMHAEITCFGLKWALWYDELIRDINRFNNSRKVIEVGKFSGAVGNYLTTSIEIEKTACEYLSISAAPISTQVLSRDRHIEYITSLAMIASLLEKIATEIRSLSRSEIKEVAEPFGANQKGSSAMPHKKNPITSENICGCARIMRSYVSVAFENNILWHERDISHSSAERIILADSTTLLDYMLNRYTKTLENLVVDENKMIENIYLTGGVVFSGNVLNHLVLAGLSREKAYDLIQPLTFISLNNNIAFKEVLKNSEVANYLTELEIDDCFNINYYLKNILPIYKNVGIIKEDKNE